MKFVLGPFVQDRHLKQCFLIHAVNLEMQSSWIYTWTYIRIIAFLSPQTTSGPIDVPSAFCLYFETFWNSETDMTYASIRGTRYFSSLKQKQQPQCRAILALQEAPIKVQHGNFLVLL
jgi:hypothetical protein